MALLSSIVFIVALALIATERIHRTVVVLVGAALFVLVGVLDQHDAFDAIDLDTLGLLVGMMVIVAITERTGIFEYLAILALRLSRGRPLALVASMVTMTAVMSALLDNLTSILLVAPITIIVASKLGMAPVPLLVMQILASNIGGTATLIGDPPNIMIAGATGLTFNEFAKNLAPVSIVTLVVVTAALYAANRRSFAIAKSGAEIHDLQPDVELAQGRALWIPLGVLMLTIAAFFGHSALHLEPATIALAGAALLLLIGASDVDETLQGLDWATLFFFGGLFVMVGGLEHAGVIDSIAEQTQRFTQGSRTGELLGIMGIAATGSAFVDNIPFTAAMIPVVEQLNEADDDAYWWSLALGACFGGNATIVAAAANVACQGVAERHGITITFREFLKWGIPATLLSLAIATGYITLFHI